MWRITALLACACTALALAGSASSTTFGVADDAGKYADDGGASFFNMLTDLGMTENRIAVFWDPANPTTIVDQAFLDRAVPQAMRRGLEVMFAIYPLKARALVDTPNGVQLFAQYAARVAQGYQWPKVGCVNLDRFKQAWWDAFHGTGQPLFREAGPSGPGPFVRIYVDEVGYQARVAADKAALYTGAENVPTIDETTQASYYSQLIASMACDPNVALLNFFHAVDETSLPAWQSGMVMPDGTHRASYAAVKQAIVANQQCKGTLAEWRHSERVVGASATLKTL